MNQARQHPCGCVDNIFRNVMITDLCNQHLAIANSPASRQQQGMRGPQGQIPTATGGTQSHPFFQSQTAGFGHPFQMPPPGVRVQMQR